MLRVSKLADYAIVVALRLAGGEVVQTSSGLAAATGIPEPTVAKVLKLLSAGGVVGSLRGARGGYRLARPLGAVSIADVIGAVDGPITLTACVEGASTACEVGGRCALNGRWDVVNDVIRGALESISLAALRDAPTRARIAAAVQPATPLPPAR